MATFTEIYYNGNEYKQMWLNGTKVWEKSGGIVYPYPDADSVVTYKNPSSYGSLTITFDIIDDSLPYSINGTNTSSFTLSSYSTEQLKLVNLKPKPETSLYLLNIEQLRIPKLTDLSNLFEKLCYNSNYEYSWSPQYFEFHPNPTNMSYMFYQSKLTDDMMAQFMPYFPNTNQVTNMQEMFSYSSSNLTSLNLSNFNTGKVTNMEHMFYECSKLTSLDLSSFDTSQVTSMRGMFYGCSKLTSLDLSNFNTSQITNTYNMFYYCSKLTSLNLSNWDTSNITNMSQMFYNCSKLTSLDLSSFDTSKVTNSYSMFTAVKDCTIYIGDKWTLGTSSTFGNGINLTFVLLIPIKSIQLSHDIEDTSNVTQASFTITPSILPTNYTGLDLQVIYDSTYMSVVNNRVNLKDGCQGKTLSITYRSKKDNTISNTLTFTVSQDLEIGMDAIDFTQSTAPTLPNYMTLDGQGSSYYFSHGTYTTDVYGLVPNNSGEHSTIAYTRYKYIAPKDGVLTFTYRCSSESTYDYLTVHVDTSTSQPSYSNSINGVVINSGTTYATTDGTASVNVTKGTTYYIHIQYRKDSSGAYGYDKGGIRKIELL